MFDACPGCGKRHVFKPKKCGCGYESGKPALQIKCPYDDSPLDLNMRECPECKRPVDELIQLKCPKCWKWTSAKNRYCQNCAAELWHEEASCPFCKKMIDARSITCPKCGKNLYVQEQEHVPETYHCATCGMQLATASSACPICSAPKYYE